MELNIQSGRLFTVFALLLFVVFGPAARADLVTSADQIANAAVIDFSEFNTPWLYTAGPVQIGGPVSRDIEWFSTNSNAVIGNDGYGLDANGSWTAGRLGYTGLNTSSGSMTYRFNDSPVSAVGGFVNYAVPNYGAAIMEVLDQNGAVLESYDVSAVAPISTPNGIDEGAFRGIVRPQADIYALRLNNAYDVLDDLTFSADVVSPYVYVPVPTLSTWAMLVLAGLLAMFAMVRRRA